MWFLKRALPILLGLLYIVSPIDAIPDFIPGVGWLDDLFVLGFLVWYLRSQQRGSSPWDLFRGRVGGPRAQRPGAPRPEDLSADFTQMDPHALLEISSGATPEEVKVAYRRAVSRYHPDKVAHLGPEFQELAHKKLLAIQSAYEALKSRQC